MVNLLTMVIQEQSLAICVEILVSKCEKDRGKMRAFCANWPPIFNFNIVVILIFSHLAAPHEYNINTFVWTSRHEE